MPGRRSIVGATLVLTALAVQVSVLAQLGLPGGAPDLLLLVVIAFALAEGPLPGLVLGFGAGLALDLVPPADHAAGRWALVLCLAGYLCGQVRIGVQRSIATQMLLVVAVTAGTHLLYAAFGLLLSDPRVSVAALALGVPATVFYTLVLAPMLLPSIGALCRRHQEAAFGLGSGSGPRGSAGRPGGPVRPGQPTRLAGVRGGRR